VGKNFLLGRASSYSIFVSLVVRFNIAGNVCLAILRYRLGQKGLLSSLVENFKWITMFTVFFVGLSFHLNGVIFAHLLDIDTQWGTTSKKVVNTNFFQDVPKIFKSCKWMYLAILIIAVSMVYLGNFAPRGYGIQGITVTVCCLAIRPIP